MDHNLLNLILNNRNLVDRIMYLHGRWQDERKYEDFSDYEKNLMTVITKEFPKLVIKKFTKRPFGFWTEINGRKVHVFLKVKSATCTMNARFKKEG